jgi:hypothetical protein
LAKVGQRPCGPQILYPLDGEHRTRSTYNMYG